ncbi:KRAB [Mytilus edulis]|uniref:KRAB n=1 Tax=Mytilus edulis TaxID=6550 RepID=A0A8S3S756_MYTED|nr:KRAB [Mytilus edulis]
MEEDNYKYMCKDCGQGYAKKKNLRRHRNQIHENKIKYFRCSVVECEKTYFRREYLILHLQSAHHINRNEAKEQAQRALHETGNRSEVNSLERRLFLKPCSVNIFDCLITPATSELTPIISSCKHKKGKRSTCKTCNMLITTPDFTSNLTGKTYYTKSFEPLDCSTENVVYGIECTWCGLLYFGETRQTLG